MLGTAFAYSRFSASALLVLALGCSRGTQWPTDDSEPTAAVAGASAAQGGTASAAPTAGQADALPNAGSASGGDGATATDGCGSAAYANGWARAANCMPSNLGTRNERGMDTPWVEVQAEDAKTNASVLGPSRAKWDANHIEAEAIGRRAVKLSKTGDYVAFTLEQPANSLVVRFSIPDDPRGGGIDTTLGVYVNGERVRSLSLTSRYAWSYKGTLIGDASVDIPAENPHTFFDEARLRLSDLPAGAEVRLQRDAQDNAAFYVIDLVDFEQAPPPAEMPAGFTSVTDFGALPDDYKDDANQISKALASVKKLWFPKGRYLVNQLTTGAVGLDNPGIELRGAGVWYTELQGAQASFFCVGATASCKFGDFSIFGETKARVEGQGVQKGFAGPMGKGSLIENVWIEHEIAGIWVGGDPPYQYSPTDGLTIRNVRIRDVYANGINLANGTSNSLVENSHVRNSGDEAFVVWPIKWTDWVREATFQSGPDIIPASGRDLPDQGVGHGNTFRKLTAQMPWRAQCFGSYGGYDNTFEKSYCEDVLAYPGILIDNEFSSYPFGPGLTVFRDITLLRSGGSEWLDLSGQPMEHGALEFYLREGSISAVSVENIDIVDSTFSGIEFRGFGAAYVRPGERVYPDVLRDADAATLSDVSFKNVKVTGAGGFGVQLKDGAGRGRASFLNVSVEQALRGGRDASGVPAAFFDMQQGNQGW